MMAFVPAILRNSGSTNEAPHKCRVFVKYTGDILKQNSLALLGAILSRGLIEKQICFTV